jgi:integrase
MHPHMLRQTFVTTMLCVGVDLRDVQITARHADPRSTMRYDRARKNLDRHPNRRHSPEPEQNALLLSGLTLTQRQPCTLLSCP